MKLKYEHPKGHRVKSEFMGLCNSIDRRLKKDWWYNIHLNKWQNNSEGSEISSHQNCNSVRAFRRRLKQLPKGVKFTLVSRYVGHNVYGVGSSENF